MKRSYKIKKIVILLSLIIMFFVPNNVFGMAMDDMLEKADDFVDLGVTKQNVGVISLSGMKILGTSNFIYRTFLTLAIVAAVIVGAILGIKFMMGSAIEKAEVKETMVPYIIGCMIAFGAFAIWKIFMILLSSV